MYIKLQQNFLKESCDNWDKFKSDNLVTQFVSGNISLEYYSLENVDAFRNQHLKKFYTIRPSRVLFTEINGTGFLNPHIDHNTNVTLNYYIQSIDDVTTFYETNNNIIGFNYGNRDQSNIYDVGDLSVKSEFVANNNTAYLSGQVPWMNENSDFITQTEEVFNSIDVQLAKVNSDKTKILSLRIYMKNPENYEEMNTVFKKWMPIGFHQCPTTLCTFVRLCSAPMQ
jgi:enamine deaminase RidA (YjgF/YER057c/UK114 family)